MFLGLIAAAIVLIFDQLSKHWVFTHLLANTEGVAYLPFFNVIKAWNTGVSFSMFNNYGNLGVILLSVMSILIVLFLLNWLRKEESKYIQLALGFVIGGAIGNIIDRIRFGAVFDFLDVYVGVHHWPTFNIADSFICIGAFMIIFHSVFKKNKEA